MFVDLNGLLKQHLSAVSIRLEDFNISQEEIVDLISIQLKRGLSSEYGVDIRYNPEVNLYEKLIDVSVHGSADWVHESFFTKEQTAFFKACESFCGTYKKSLEELENKC